jgi:hypothetical protein
MQKWDDLTNNDKIDRLSTVLTRAGADIKFRDRCLVSQSSAREAMKEAAEVEFPADFRIEFLTPEEQLKTLVLVLPEFLPSGNGNKPEYRNAEDYQPCSYSLWRT